MRPMHDSPAMWAPRLASVHRLGYVLISLGSGQREHAVAQKVQVLLIDDIDGSAAEGMVRFGLDGACREIDLSAAHAAELRGALAPFIAAGRKVSGAGSRRAARAGRGTAGGGIDLRYSALIGS